MGDDWINVDDKLPNDTRRVLIYVNGQVDFGEYWPDMNEWSVVENYMAVDNVTDWMEIPKGPGQ